jgi:large subunit ribosomal protein L6
VSRIAKVPIAPPSGVQLSVSSTIVTIKGPKGQLDVDTRGNVKVSEQEGKFLVERHSDEGQDRAFHGLYHRLITNAIAGVTQGYERELELQGVGYKAEMKGGTLMLIVGRSHPYTYQPLPGIEIGVPDPTKIVIKGIDKELVNRTAADIRRIRPPEPYKGKGIRYKGENVRRKVGKTGAK